MLDIIKNLNQEEIIQKAKPLGVAAICLTAVFMTGFGAGKLHSGVTVDANSAKRTLSNYNTNSSPAENKATGTTATTAANTTTTPQAADGSTDCPIKGSKSKIYHLKGGAFYERTNADKCFTTEDEALAAGYKKSSR